MAFATPNIRRRTDDLIDLINAYEDSLLIAARSALHLDRPDSLQHSHQLRLVLEWHPARVGAPINRRMVVKNVLVIDPDSKAPVAVQQAGTFSIAGDVATILEGTCEGGDETLSWRRREAKNSWGCTAHMPFDNIVSLLAYLLLSSAPPLALKQ